MSLAFLSISMLVHDGAKPFGDSGCIVQATMMCASSPGAFDCIGFVVAIFSVEVNKFINSSQFWLQRLFRMLY